MSRPSCNMHTQEGSLTGNHKRPRSNTNKPNLTFACRPPSLLFDASVALSGAGRGEMQPPWTALWGAWSGQQQPFRAPRPRYVCRSMPSAHYMKYTVPWKENNSTEGCRWVEAGKMYSRQCSWHSKSTLRHRADAHMYPQMPQKCLNAPGYSSCLHRSVSSNFERAPCHARIAACDQDCDSWVTCGTACTESHQCDPGPLHLTAHFRPLQPIPLNLRPLLDACFGTCDSWHPAISVHLHLHPSAPSAHNWSTYKILACYTGIMPRWCPSRCS
jgi:hypothetical protein